MEEKKHKSVRVAYSLYAADANGKFEMVERASDENPFQFITGMGVTLDAFEQHIEPLAEGDAFDFVLSVDEAYGPYLEEHVVELSKEVFSIDGHFDSEAIYRGASVPLVNEDGLRFQGLVLDVSANTVRIDLNSPLAGKELRFVGKVVSSAEATPEEVQALINLMSGDGCECGCGGHCGHDHDAHGHCHCGHDECAHHEPFNG